MLVSSVSQDSVASRSDTNIGASANAEPNILGEPEDTTIVAEISEYIAAHISEWYGSEAKLLLPYPVQRAQRLSLILVYQIVLPGAGHVRLFAKVARRPYLKTLTEAVSLERLRRLTQAEYEILRRVSQMVAASPTADRLAAIRPIAYLERWNALVMEEFPSTSVSRLLFSPRSLFASSAQQASSLQALFHSGVWLRQFHRTVGDSTGVAFDAQEMVQELDALIRKLRSIMNRPSYFDTLQAQVRSWCMKLDQLPVTVVLSHGDFHLGNVLLSSDAEVAVIDFDQCSRKPIYADVANLLTDLTVRKQQVLSYGLLIRRSRLARYEQSFLQGYFGDQTEDTLAFVSLFCVWLVLRKWLSDELRFTTLSRWKQLVGVPIQLSMRQYFLRLIVDYLNLQRPARF